MLDYLFLEGQRMPKKSIRFFNALYRSANDAGLQCEKSERYRPCKVLVVYGPGGPDRYPFVQEQIEAGRAAILFDIGYWDRAGNNRKYRFSLNGLHPDIDMLMAGECPGPERYEKTGQAILPDAPKTATKRVLLVGNAAKACAVGARGWTASKSRQIRAVMSDYSIAWRPKPGRPRETKVEHDSVSTESIERAIRSATFVVCKHSNVAIDACVMGAPVICESGAASAIYPSSLSDRRRQPTPEQRRDFLYRLAYWQWGIDETADFWSWFFRTFPAYDYR